MVYVTNSIDKLFLSREACLDLGIISSKFPTMDEAIKTALPALPLSSQHNRNVNAPGEQSHH